MTKSVLKIDASARFANSTTRALTAQIVEKLGGEVTQRDLTDAIPQIDEVWVNANFTAAQQRTTAQNAKLELSDSLVAEIRDADVLVIGVPIYNFGIPAALKAWIDQIARAGVTFKYTENGPVGLMQDKKAVIAIASGGTAIGSDIDFASGYMRHIMGFIGITDVTFVVAERQMADAEKAIADAVADIEKLAA